MAQNFDFILSRLRPELEEMNRIIIRTLHTDNRMMNDVVSPANSVKVSTQWKPLKTLSSWMVKKSKFLLNLMQQTALGLLTMWT